MFQTGKREFCVQGTHALRAEITGRYFTREKGGIAISGLESV